ncbi:MAG: permease-like cell division protein FtsX [Bacillota bacterium]
MGLNSLWYCLRQTFVSLHRNCWLGVASAAMIMVTLVILGTVLLVAVNAGHFMRNIESTVEINVFLDDGADIPDLRQRLNGLQGVENYTFIPKEQALQELKKSFGEKSDLLAGFEGENNPLPDSFRVKALEAEAVPALAHQISFFPGVNKIRYGEEYVDRLVKASRWVNMIALGAVILLAAGAVFLIVTTIRLSLVAREDEVGIMKYLGASNWFVRSPFVLEGIFVGLTGALAAVTVLGGAYYCLLTELQKVDLIFFLRPVTDRETLAPLFLGLLGLGVLMGGAGSWISLRKFLRV